MVRIHAIAILAASLLSGCGLAKVPVSVQQTPAGVTIHCESLGEYPSDIGFIELKDVATRRTVWRVEPVGQLFQLHNFDLVPGSNSSIIPVYWGSVRSVVPEKGSFILHRGTRYLVTVCAPSRFKRCGQGDFTL